MRKGFFLLTFTFVLALAAGNARADAVTGLTTFTSGTPAYADSVNANFSEIDNSVDDNDARITSLESTKTDYIYIPAATMTPEDDTVTYTTDMSSGTLIITGPVTKSVLAPVHVPDGATITEFMFNGIDNTASYQFLGYLIWQPINATTGGESWGGGTGTSPGYVEKTYNPNHVVDNSANKYWIRMYMNPLAGVDNVMYGARVTYTYSP